MNVAIISNCQGEGLSNLIERMSGTITSKFYLSTQLQDGILNLAKVFDENDYVFAQTPFKSHVPSGLEDKVIYFPSIIFTGFHPDLTFVRGVNHKGEAAAVNSPLVVYHSLITVAAYTKGLTVEETLKHYNARTYAELGYFDAYKTSCRELIAEGRDVGMPLEDYFHKWRQRGNFMYSFNHPELFVSADIAGWILDKIGVPVKITSAYRYMADSLRAMPVWPVYPEIAEHYGFKGDYIFKQHDPHGELTLAEFITGCFKNLEWYRTETIETYSQPLEAVHKAMGLDGGGVCPRNRQGQPLLQIAGASVLEKISGDAAYGGC